MAAERSARAAAEEPLPERAERGMEPLQGRAARVGHTPPQRQAPGLFGSVCWILCATDT